MSKEPDITSESLEEVVENYEGFFRWIMERLRAGQIESISLYALEKPHAENGDQDLLMAPYSARGFGHCWEFERKMLGPSLWKKLKEKGWTKEQMVELGIR